MSDYNDRRREAIAADQERAKQRELERAEWRSMLEVHADDIDPTASAIANAALLLDSTISDSLEYLADALRR